MTTASALLLVIGLLGAFDIAYFHHHRCDLGSRPESRKEVWIHVARGVVYTLQLALVPNVRFQGAWFGVFVALYVADVAVALYDVFEETASRKTQGGLPRGEYFMHIVLSLLVGAYLRELVLATRGWPGLPAAIVYAPAAPDALRAVLGVMSIGCLAVAIGEAIGLLLPARPRPVHVSVRLRTTVERLWDITQDHVEHPRWDHRFSRITMLSDRVTTGTEMLYEKRIGWLVIRGWGRYKLHRTHQQSTFAFGSDSPLSLIREGVGLWLYRPVGDGQVDFSTSYTYAVRWGLVGRLFDALVFRPFFQRETERSFRRLAELHFSAVRVEVLGACGNKPRRAPVGAEIALTSA